MAPDKFRLVERPPPKWTVATANAIMHLRRTDWPAALAPSTCPALSESCRTGLALHAQTRTVASDKKRLGGNTP